MIVPRQAVAATLQPFARAISAIRPGHRILMYHRVQDTATRDQLSVSAARFLEQIRSLRDRRVITLHTACQELANGIDGAGVALTFDDGYADNLTVALPMLEQYGIPATIFVVTGFCDGLQQHPRYPGEAGLHLNWAQLRQLASHPLIEIGSHTLTHPLLATLDERSAEHEIADSRRRLEDQLGKPIRYFCYPAGNFSERDARLAAAAGYEAAVTVRPGCNRPGRSPFLLNRTEVTDADRGADLRAKLDGAYDLPHLFLHWKRLRRFRGLQRRSEQLRGQQ